MDPDCCIPGGQFAWLSRRPGSGRRESQAAGAAGDAAHVPAPLPGALAPQGTTIRNSQVASRIRWTTPDSRLARPVP
jgi:hypothetical protein